MILVLGATGTTGGLVLQELVGRGAPVRGVTTSPERAQALRDLGADAVVADLADPATLERAMAGVERMYLVTGGGERQATLEGNAIAAAEQAGVYHVVKLGVIAQAHDAPFRFARSHAEAFDTLQGSSLRWTLLQPNGFMQNYLRTPPGVTSRPDAPVSHVDARDIAAVAARALTEEGHESCSYLLTGPAPITDREIAATIGEITGREIPVTEIADADFAAALGAMGVPAWSAEGLVELAAFYRSGAAAAPAPDIEGVLGRPATSFRRFAEDHADRLRALAGA